MLIHNDTTLPLRQLDFSDFAGSRQDTSLFQILFAKVPYKQTYPACCLQNRKSRAVGPALYMHTCMCMHAYMRAVRHITVCTLMSCHIQQTFPGSPNVNWTTICLVIQLCDIQLCVMSCARSVCCDRSMYWHALAVTLTLCLDGRADFAEIYIPYYILGTTYCILHIAQCILHLTY